MRSPSMAPEKNKTLVRSVLDIKEILSLFSTTYTANFQDTFRTKSNSFAVNPCVMVDVRETGVEQ